ncbi:MAG: hypothetical protein IIA17_01180 [candidate division Zixibacteria bacterium]|nr:hypothetical protein [candidate division Zixibacteria bacterium]
MESLLFEPASWFSVLGSFGLLLAGHIATRYVVPFLKVGKRQRYAELIAQLADELTDELRNKHDKSWAKYLDEAVDKLIILLGISPEIARRAVKAAAARK